MVRLVKECAKEGCKGKRFCPRQEVEKVVLDADYKVVSAWRNKCVHCGRTFWDYPRDVGYQPISHRVIRLAVMMCVLGLSYGAVAIVLEALGIGIGKSSVYRAVQAAAE